MMNKDCNLCNCENSLKTSFNLFWGSVLGIKDYYGLLSLNQFIELKRVLSDINNIITLRTTVLFLNLLKSKSVLTEKQYNEALKIVNNTNANTNGYDIQLESPKLIAEIKCNIPIKNDSFGSNQGVSILKDIMSLKDTSKKRKVHINSSDDFYRFMVLLDSSDKSNTRIAMKNILNKLKDEDIYIVEEPEIDWKNLSTKCVYVLYISVE